MSFKCKKWLDVFLSWYSSFISMKTRPIHVYRLHMLVDFSLSRSRSFEILSTIWLLLLFFLDLINRTWSSNVHFSNNWNLLFNYLLQKNNINNNEKREREARRCTRRVIVFKSKFNKWIFHKKKWYSILKTNICSCFSAIIII